MIVFGVYKVLGYTVPAVKNLDQDTAEEVGMEE